MKNFHLKEHPRPVGRGWECSNDTIRAIRISRPALPDPNNDNQHYVQQPHDSDTDIEESDNDTEFDSSSGSSDEE